MRTSRVAALLGLAALCALAAGYAAMGGGVDTHVGPVRLRSRSWERPAALAAALAVAALLARRREAAAAIRRFGRAGERGLRLAVVSAASWTLVVSLAYGTYAAGGSDSSGYLNQAELMARGRLTATRATHPAFTWPHAAATLAPLGFAPGRQEGRLAPTYPPGLPLLMTPLAVIDARAVFLIVPLAAVLAVWLCWRLGLALGEPLAGALGACLLATSPAFLYHAVQPMGDVPVTACWISALLLARRGGAWNAAGAGVAASAAILIRPNLAPLAAFVVAGAAARPGAGVRLPLLCVLAMLPGIAGLGLIQLARYGSSVASGYGALRDLFSAANVMPNLRQYTRWLTETQTVLVWSWLLAPAWIRTAPEHVRRFAWICCGFAAAVVAAYLPYAVFNPEEWFYTRFLLPAYPPILVLGLVVLLWTGRRVAGRFGEPAVVLLTTILAAGGVARAASDGAFELRLAERRYPAVGAFVRDQLPANAAVIVDQHSGSILYYAGRTTVRWQLLEPDALGAVVEGLRQAGYQPYLVLDPFEEPVFRARFASSSARTLDSLRPVATIEGTRIYLLE